MTSMSFGARRRRGTAMKIRNRRSAFKAAAKACKGKKISAFRACMKQHLKK